MIYTYSIDLGGDAFDFKSEADYLVSSWLGSSICYM